MTYKTGGLFLSSASLPVLIQGRGFLNNNIASRTETLYLLISKMIFPTDTMLLSNALYVFKRRPKNGPSTLARYLKYFSTTLCSREAYRPIYVGLKNILVLIDDV